MKNGLCCCLVLDWASLYCPIQQLMLVLPTQLSKAHFLRELVKCIMQRIQSETHTFGLPLSTLKISEH